MAIIYRDGCGKLQKMQHWVQMLTLHRCASRLTSGFLNTAKQKQTNKINWAMEMYVEKNV